MPFAIALSGLNAAQTDLKVTGNNIANSSTTGFKQSRAEFSDVYAVNFGGSTSTATGNGVKVANVAQIFNQGSIDFTQRNLDLAISGEGFFVVEDDTGTQYTRNGTFYLDSDGYIVNNKGQSLQLFPSVDNGSAFNTGVLTDVQLSVTDGPPSASTEITAGLNLNAGLDVPAITTFDPDDPTSYNNSTSIVVYDSLGSEHTASMYFAKTAANTWDAYTYVDGNLVQNSAGDDATEVTFNPDGTLNTPATITLDDYTPGTGADPLALTLDLGSMTQFGSPFSVGLLTQDGYASGRLSSLDVSDEGVVFARFTNGQSQAIGKVALANFANPNGLRQVGDTNWTETFDSGSKILGGAGSGRLGLIQSGALESSNVDISEQLVRLITAQRNFQANAQVISTADTVTQTIINI